MLSQRLVIRLLPLEVLFVGAIAVGWALVRVDGAPVLQLQLVEPSAPVSVEPVAASSGLSPVFTPEVQHWASEISTWATRFNLDPNLVATVMQIESCGWPNAVSKSGAQGLFQVMPFHFNPEDVMQDPDVNADRGLAYLALGLQRAGGDVGRALAGYNGGHSQIGKDPALWPEQTKRYWYWGVGIYTDALSGQATSPRLEEWLQSGGASLCAHAAEALKVN